MLLKEYKTLKNQVQEIEKYKKMTDEQKILRKEYYLIQQYDIENDIIIRQNIINNERVSIDILLKKNDTIIEKLIEYQKNVSQSRRDCLHNEKNRSKYISKLSNIYTIIDKLKYEQITLDKNLDIYKKNKNDNKIKIYSLDDKLKNIDNEILILQDELNNKNKLEKNIQKIVKNFQDNYINEYLLCKDEQKQKYNDKLNRYEIQQREQRIYQQDIINCEKYIKTYTQMKKSTTDIQNTIDNDIKELSMNSNKIVDTIKDLENTINITKDTIETKKNLREHLKDELQKQRINTLEIKTDQINFDKQIRLRQCVEHLRTWFPTNVRGFLQDLIKPIQDNLILPIRICIGKYLQAIVVTDENIAIKCSQYLKDKHIGMAIFLPLTKLHINIQNLEILREKLYGNYRLLYDCILCDDIDKRAVQYACNDTLLCSTIDEAKDAAYNNIFNTNTKRNIRIITYDGTIIHRSGTMTGGVDKSNASNNNTNANKQLEYIEKMTLSKKYMDEQIMLSSCTGTESLPYIETKLEKYTIEQYELQEKLKEYKQRIDEKVNILNDNKKQLKIKENLQDEYNKKLDEYNKLLKDCNNELKDLQDTMNEKINEIFKELFIKQDIKTLDELEYKYFENIIQIQENISIVKQKLIQQENNKQDIKQEYDEQNIQDKNNDKNIHDIQKNYDIIQNKLNHELNICKDIEKKFENIENDYKKSQEDLQKKESILNEYQDISIKNHEELSLKRQKVTKLTTYIQELLNRKMIIYNNANRDYINIPIQSNTTVNDTNSNETTVTQNPKIDFSSLPNSIISKKNQNIDERETVYKEYEKKIEELQEKVDTLIPITQLIQEEQDDVNQKIQNIQDNYQEKLQAQREANDTFEEIKKQRKERFQDIFNHIKKNINSIYQLLTSTGTMSIQGHASISLDNDDEPYLYGINYIVNPPLKRSRDIKQLSGGEKTLAALAFIFSIHSYHSAPFVILDEIDAPLDRTNISRVASYITTRSRGLLQCCENYDTTSSSIDPNLLQQILNTTQQTNDENVTNSMLHGLQFIIISLKDILCSHANSLIGIYYNKDTKSSSILTLDLQPFRDNTYSEDTS